jgi:D-arginine dehydrogenase
VSTKQQFDFIVVGAGIAGASAAASLARRGRVVLVEGEPHVGYHTTGRSAALFSAIYGNACIRALTRASRAFFWQPPAGFASAPLVHPRATLYFAAAAEVQALERFRDSDPEIAKATKLLSGPEANQLIPAFRHGYVQRAALEDGSADIDVDQLHQGFLRQMHALGGKLVLGRRVRTIGKTPTGWNVSAGDSEFSAPVVVNAAGAWGDAVAAMAGIAPIGLQPMRRTVLLIDSPSGAEGAQWPAAVDIGEQFYFKPDAGMLLLSPADETPSAPCDAQPEEIDVAIAVDRFEQATGLVVRRVSHKWAGLRVFSPDRTPVVGFEPTAEGFFWLAGQGGYGIQTAPAMGELAAALAAGEPMPVALRDEAVDAGALSPARLR